MSVSPHTQTEDENQVIDKMFAFVKHEHMETPKSSIITRHRSMSTPRRPLATSTPLFTSNIASHLHNLKHRCELASINSNTSTSATTTTIKDSPNNKIDDTVAAAISQQQIFQSKCRAILTEISYQQDQVIQASDVIAMCQKKYIFNGTFQEMNAQRTLLVANERRYALHREFDNLKKQYSINKEQISVKKNVIYEDDMPPPPPPPKCAVNIRSIKILLNRSFYIKTVDEDISFAFVAICKTENQMYATQLMSVLDMGTLRVSTVQFRESIRFQNLSTDFALLIEIFALKIMKRSISPRYACASKIASKAKALMSGHTKKPIVQTLEGNDSFFPTSDFHRCGFLQLNRLTMNKQQFLLEEVEYPLEGTIEIRCEYIFI